MDKKKILSAVTLVTIAASSTIGMGTVFATKGNVRDTDKCVYFALEDEETVFTSEKLKEILKEKGFSLETELTGNVKTGTQITVKKDGVTYNYAVVLLGDANGDGELDLRDTVRLRKYIINNEDEDLLITDFSDPIKLAMDVNGDKEIDLRDTVRLRKMNIGNDAPEIPDEELPDSKKDFAKQSLTELAKYADTEVTAENVEAITAAVEAAKAAVGKVEGATDLEGYDNIAKIEAKIEAYNKSIEENPEEKALETAKSDAIKEISETYPQENYDEEDWKVVQEAIDFINTLKDATQVNNAKAEQLTKIEGKKLQTKKQKLEAAITVANTQIDEIRASYETKATDYREAEKAEINTIISEAKSKLENIDKATATVQDVENIVTSLRTDLKAVKTDLDLQKEEFAQDKENAKKSLDEYKSTLNLDNYSDENKAKIDSIIQAGKDFVDAVKFDDTDAMNQVERFIEATKLELETVPTITADLDKLKTAKKDEISSKINTEGNNYSDEDKAKIDEIKTNAIANIEKAGTVEEVNAIAQEALSKLDEYRTVKQNEAINAIKSLYNEKDYYSSDWKKMNETINQKISEIEKMSDDEIDIDTIKTDLQNSLKDYETITQQYTNAKAKALSDLANNYKEDNYKYDTEVLAKFKEEYTKQHNLIASKETKTEVEAAYKTAETELNKFKTEAQKKEEEEQAAKKALEEAKTTALSELKQAYDKYVADKDNYENDKWTELDGYNTAAIAAINATDATIASVGTAKTEAITKMANVETKAQKALAKAKQNAGSDILNEYRNNYKSMIKDAGNAYITTVYTIDNGKKIEAIVNGRIKALEDLTTIDEVNAKKEEIINSMKAIEKIAQTELKTELEKMTSEASYETMKTIVETAIEKIADLKNATDIANAKQNAITKVHAIGAIDRVVKEKNAKEYYTADWAQINTIAKTAIGDIVAATDSSENDIVDGAKEKINAVKTIAKINEEYAEKAIETIEASYEPRYYTDEQNEKITEIINKAVKDMENAATTIGIDNIKNNAIKAIEEYTSTLEKKLDLSGNNAGEKSITTVTNTFTQSNYNKVSNNPDVKVADDEYYMDLGKYLGEENPTVLSIGTSSYDNSIRKISIGNNSFINAPVWKISEAGNILVALTYLNVDSLPTGNTKVSVGGQEINVNLGTENNTKETLTLGNVVTSNPDKATATKDSDKIIMNYTHRAVYCGVELLINGEAITDEKDIVIIVKDKNGNVGLTKLDQFSNGNYGCAVYPEYADADVTEAKTSTREYTLGIPGYGVIDVNFEFNAVLSLN